MDQIERALSFIKKHGLYPKPPVLSAPHATTTIVNDKEMLLFASNNYLGMMHDPRVVDAAVEGVRKWGIGNGSARLLTGNIEIHQALENKVAQFKEREAALTFVSGYMANSGTIPAIVNVFKPSLTSFLTGKIARDKNTIVFSDEFNHASIIAGIKFSGAHKEIYKHCDVDDLQRKLAKYSKRTRKIIITDGVFSMDGDIAPLPKILELARQYKALVYLDDAHATGILGKNGKGVEDYFGINHGVDVVMGTFTKAFGGVGGFIVGSNNLIDYVKITADTFVFTAPIAPPVVYGLMKAIEIVENEPWRREVLLKNAQYLREKLHELGFNTGNSQTQVIPIIIGDEKKAIRASELLLERNIFIPAARWPAVPHKSARLRVALSCEHTQDQIDYLVGVLREIRQEIKF